jgi:replicative DNA helicase
MESPGVPTGLLSLDRRLAAGGFSRGVLTALAADTSRGKTALAGQAALHAALAGQRVITVTLEDWPRRVVIRNLANLSAIPNRQLQNLVVGPDEWNGLTTSAGRLSDLGDRIVFFGPDAGSVDVVCSKALRHARQHGCDLLIWDYLQKTKGPAKDSQLRETNYCLSAIERVSMQLPDTATVLISQFRRRDENTPPRLKDLRHSGEIEQSARSVLFIWAPPKFDRMPCRFVILAKQSDGEKCGVVLGWEGDRVRFRDATVEEAKEYESKIRGLRDGESNE